MSSTSNKSADRLSLFLTRPIIVIFGVANALTILSGVLYKHTVIATRYGRTVQEIGAGWPIAFVGDAGANSPLSSAGIITFNDWIMLGRLDAYLGNVLIYSAVICVFYGCFRFFNYLRRRNETRQPIKHEQQLQTDWLNWGFVILGLASALTVLSGLIYKHTYNFRWMGRTVQEDGAGWQLAFIGNTLGNVPSSYIGINTVHDWFLTERPNAYLTNVLIYSAVICVFCGCFSIYTYLRPRNETHQPIKHGQQQESTPRSTEQDPHDWS